MRRFSAREWERRTTMLKENTALLRCRWEIPLVAGLETKGRLGFIT
jgi:hypothetical protein